MQYIIFEKCQIKSTNVNFSCRPSWVVQAHTALIIILPVKINVLFSLDFSLLNEKISVFWRKWLLLTVVSYLSASREHQLPHMLRRWQVPRSGSLPGLVCVVCIFSDLGCRLAGGQTGNYIYSDDQYGRDGISTRHYWWYGWVICLWSVPMCFFTFSKVVILPLLRKTCFFSWQIASDVQLYTRKAPAASPGDLWCTELKKMTPANQGKEELETCRRFPETDTLLKM